MFGASQMAAKLREIAKKFPDRVKSALYVEAQIEMTEAKRRTPVWNPDVKVPKGVVPGALRASGRVELPKRAGRNIYVVLAFGGPALVYAIYVHENPDAYHKIGQWKFLESVLMESRAHMAARIAARVHLGKP